MKLALKLGAVLLAGLLCGGPVEAGMVLSAAPAGGGGPANTVAPQLTPTGSVAFGAALACSQGTWTGNPTITYSYQFFRGGSTSVLGPGSTTNYTTVNTDVGSSITCTVTATNSVSSASATTNAVAVTSGAPAGNCSQSTTYFSRVWAQGITLDGTVGASVGAGTLHLGAYDALICHLVSDNNTWGTLDRLYVFATQAATGSSTTLALIDLVSGDIATANGGPAFTPNTGYQGTSGSSLVYIDTHFNATVGTPHYTQNIGHISLWSFTDGIAATGVGAGIGVSSSGAVNYTALSIWYTDARTYGPVNVNATVHQPDVAGMTTGMGLGSWIANRTGAAANQMHWKGAAQVIESPGASDASVALVNANFYVLAYNNNGTAVGSGRMFGAATIGYGLDPATQISSSGGTTGTGLVPRLCTFMTAIHGSC